MIEVAGKNKWVELNQSDAKLYMFSLGDGWRFPTLDECYKTAGMVDCWSTTRVSDAILSRFVWLVIPVRDLKDD